MTFKTENDRQERLDQLNRLYEGLSDSAADDARAAEIEAEIAAVSMAEIRGD